MTEKTLKLLTPCHQAPIELDTEYLGRDRGGDVVVGYTCSADDCLNVWDLEGNPIPAVVPVW